MRERGKVEKKREGEISRQTGVGHRERKKERQRGRKRNINGREPQREKRLKKRQGLKKERYTEIQDGRVRQIERESHTQKDR